jgi:hypothetical protein
MVHWLPQASSPQPPATVHGVVFDIFVVRPRKPLAGKAIGHCCDLKNGYTRPV